MPEEIYHPGLEGVIAGETAISTVSGGLSYRGYSIEDLARNSSFEEVAYLLLYGDLPNAEQLDEFHKRLEAASQIPPAIIEAIRHFPATANPMDVLRSGASMLAHWDPEIADNSHDANVRKAERLLAQLPIVMAAHHRLKQGKEPVPPEAGRSLAANCLNMLFRADPSPGHEKAMDVSLILYAEHEYNASTFTSRVVVSTLSDLHSGIVAAIGALKGPLHGGANEKVMDVLGAVGKKENAEKWIRDALARKEKIMGFGHRVYKKGDSRVPVMRDLAREMGQRFREPHWVATCEALESAMEKQKGLYANVDLYAATVFHLMKIPMELNTPIFACARMAGWCAHVIEQHDHNRIIRPSCRYTGPGRRAYSALRA